MSTITSVVHIITIHVRGIVKAAEIIILTPVVGSLSEMPRTTSRPIMVPDEISPINECLHTHCADGVEEIARASAGGSTDL